MTRFFILPWYRWFGYLLLAACLLTAAEAWNIGIRDVRGGGILGAWLYARSDQVFSPAGSALVWFFALLAAMELSFRISWLALTSRGVKATAEQMRKLPKAKLPSLSGKRPGGLFPASEKPRPSGGKPGLFSISFGLKKNDGVIDIEPVAKNSGKPAAPSAPSSPDNAPKSSSSASSAADAEQETVRETERPLSGKTAGKQPDAQTRRCGTFPQGGGESACRKRRQGAVRFPAWRGE